MLCVCLVYVQCSVCSVCFVYGLARVFCVCVSCRFRVECYVCV